MTKHQFTKIRIHEMRPDGSIRETDTRRVRYAQDAEGNVVEGYEELTEYGILVANNLYRHYKDLYRDRAEEARERFRKKKASPLEYFMYGAEMELELVMSLTGFTKREVKKHMKHDVFQKLEDAVVKRYADAFGTNVDTMRGFRG